MLAREDEMAWGPVVKKPQEMPQAKICIISLRWKWTPKKKKGKMDFFHPLMGQMASFWMQKTFEEKGCVP